MAGFMSGFSIKLHDQGGSIYGGVCASVCGRVRGRVHTPINQLAVCLAWQRVHTLCESGALLDARRAAQAAQIQCDAFTVDSGRILFLSTASR